VSVGPPLPAAVVRRGTIRVLCRDGQQRPEARVCLFRGRAGMALGGEIIGAGRGAADRGEYRKVAGAAAPNLARHQRLIDAGLFSCDRIFRRLSFASRRLAILRRQSIWRLGCGDRDWCCVARSGLNREGTN